MQLVTEKNMSLTNSGYKSVLENMTESWTIEDAWSLGCVMAELLTGMPPSLGKIEADQLFKIFDVLGVPCKRAWQAMKPQAYDDEVLVWRARQLRARHRNRLLEMFPEEMLSRDGFQVLKGLLTCDPDVTPVATGGPPST
ncbi:putative cyclin-dependent kinase F-2 [Setaria viridis]|uniref:putative cyclin-dependent kinase F-2 n=1 Tax=Setaria viridis TaxID=4556 RepID=UPI00149373BA|nr:putative cyclin-dependent kinase F-2 isoform X1 [Setaria viridis]